MVTIAHALRSHASRSIGLAYAMPTHLRLLVLAVALVMFAGPGESSVATGSYTGNGTTQSITGFANQPEIVIIKGNLANPAVIRTDTMSGSDSRELYGWKVFEGNLITSLDSNGFTVGSDDRVNKSGETYYYIGMRATGVDAETGSYTGNGQSSGYKCMGYEC